MNKASADDAFADHAPAVFAGLVSATAGTALLNALTDERELLVLLSWMLLPLVLVVQEVMERVYRWDDGKIDRFEAANLRPLVFISSLLSFLALQFSTLLLLDTVTQFRAPPAYDALALLISILGVALFFVPLIFKLLARRHSSSSSSRKQS